MKRHQSDQNNNNVSEMVGHFVMSRLVTCTYVCIDLNVSVLLHNYLGWPSFLSGHLLFFLALPRRITRRRLGAAVCWLATHTSYLVPCDPCQ